MINARRNFHAKRNGRLDGFIIDGIFVSARTCNHRYTTSSRSKLPMLLESKGTSCVPHFCTGKYLYWRPITRKGILRASRLGLMSNPYPKPLEDITR